LLDFAFCQFFKSLVTLETGLILVIEVVLLLLGHGPLLAVVGGVPDLLADGDVPHASISGFVFAANWGREKGFHFSAEVAGVASEDVFMEFVGFCELR
jgi:hypothetical protein